MEFVASIIRNIPLLEDRMHRKLGDAVHGAENRGNAPDLSAVVQDTLHRAGQGSACCDGPVKDQHVFCPGSWAGYYPGRSSGLRCCIPAR